MKTYEVCFITFRGEYKHIWVTALDTESARNQALDDNWNISKIVEINEYKK